ncbi:hypothetical protein [Streptomyces sp. NBC_01518]|uniref:hypothetical protein n=1 Tax=Streptomyces sp. NBC_01518 TaxID=2903891 RepID=UPI00386B1AFB
MKLTAVHPSADSRSRQEPFADIRPGGVNPARCDLRKGVLGRSTATPVRSVQSSTTAWNGPGKGATQAFQGFAWAARLSRVTFFIEETLFSHRVTQDYTVVVMESPFCLVDLNPSAPPLPARDQVLVGVSAQPKVAPGDLDVLLTAAPDAPRPWLSCTDPHTTARRLRASVTRQPAASVAWIQVLRVGAVLTPPDRLLVQSLAYSVLLGPVVVGTATGLNSELVKRRKVFIVGSTVLGSAETLFLFYVERPWAMFVLGS